MGASRSTFVNPPFWGVAFRRNLTYLGARGGSMRRLTAVLVVVVLVGFAASAARLTLPGVRENTRGTTAPTMTAEPARLSVRDAGRAASAGGAKPLVTATTPARVPATRTHATRPARLAAPPMRAPGANALGTSLPKSRRSLVLGGHGRHGAG